eukprot:2216684-Pyramimonas_sp.AAC.1
MALGILPLDENTEGLVESLTGPSTLNPRPSQTATATPLARRIPPREVMPGRGHRAGFPLANSPVKVPQLLLQRGQTRQTSRRPFDEDG